MTLEEISNKYIKIFILVIESAGNITGNSSYLRVEQILEDEVTKEAIAKAVREDVDFKIFVTILIFEVLKDIHGIEKLAKMNVSETSALVTDMYMRYLKKPTKRFCVSNGIPVFDDPEMGIYIIEQFKE